MSTGAVRNERIGLHGIVFLAALGATTATMSPVGWPWYLLLPLSAYAIIVLAWPPLRRTAPRLRVGRLKGWPFAAAAALGVATSATLVVFHALAHPEVAHLAARLQIAAFRNVILAGVCFSVTNAVFEELIFRGVLWEVVAAEWTSGVALCSTAIFFGLGHLHGYPPGPLGAALACVFGLALGLVRWWTGGLGLAIAVHMCADLTIFALLCQRAIQSNQQ